MASPSATAQPADNLALLKAGYRRTAQAVSHKQDPVKAERAGRVLESLNKKLRKAG